MQLTLDNIATATGISTKFLVNNAVPSLSTSESAEEELADPVLVLVSAAIVSLVSLLDGLAICVCSLSIVVGAVVVLKVEHPERKALLVLGIAIGGKPHIDLAIRSNC